MDRGWTKRWRKRWDKGYHKNFLLWVLMDYFIDFAAYEPKDIYLKGHGIVHLERGEWAFTQRELAAFFNVGRQQIRDHLEFMKKHEFLTQDTTQSRTQHITKIKIINYDTYQDDKAQRNPTKNPRRNQTPTQLQPNHTTPTIYTKNKRIKETDTIPSDFLIFWKAYPNKVGKLKALEAWNKQNGSRPAIEIIISKIEQFKKTEKWNSENGRYIPNPATWLNQGRWDDECHIECKRSKPPTFEEIEEMERNGL